MGNAVTEAEIDFEALQKTLIAAISAQQSGDEAGAEALFRQVNQTVPGHPAATYSLCLIALFRDDSDAAVA